MKTSLDNEYREIHRGSFQMQQDAKQSMESQELLEKLSMELICARKKHQLLHHALINMKFKSTDVEQLLSMHDEEEKEEIPLTSTIDEKKKKFQQFKQVLGEQVRQSFEESRFVRSSIVLAN